ncbi:MAG: formylglycine-generating enzyme family protein [Deltaproteobacteria bacterium]|nr:formylglycine-generating enzyme family protein [Deltaproteobacteria bacterium]
MTPPVTLRFTGKPSIADKHAAALAGALMVAVAAVFISGPAAAQLSTVVTPQHAWNPRPDASDFVVPLPCGLSMAFRPVFIPDRGYLGEIVGYFGSDPRSEQDWTENFNRRHKIYLGSPLSIEDLPAPYRPTAVALKNRLLFDEKSGRQLYLIGKYELTAAQWDAVTKHAADGGVSGEPCQFDPKAGALPVTGVSWYEAQQFTSKLMDWLLANHPEALPSIEGDERTVGVVRLPTEAEWEYAARGGHLASREDLSSLDLFPAGPGNDLSDYGIYYDGASERKSQPGMIGRRLPNPVGLYDTVGNVSEMTIDNYRIAVGSRLHGSAGGFVTKGGSFNSLYPGVLPGARAEFPFYYRHGQAKSSDMGLRLVISSVNGGNIQRLSEISVELDMMASDDWSLTVYDPVKTVDTLIQRAETDSEKSALMAVRATLVASISNAAELRSSELRSHLMDSLYTMMSMRANNARMVAAAAGRQAAVNNMKRLDALFIGNDGSDDDKKAFQDAREEQIKIRDRDHAFLQDAESSFLVMRGRYEKLLIDAKNNYRNEIILAQLDDIGRNIIGDDYFNREIRACFTNVDKHVKAVLKGASPYSIPRSELEVKPVDSKMPKPTV